MLQVVVTFQFISWMGYYFLTIVLLYLNLKPLCQVLYTAVHKLAIPLNIICSIFFNLSLRLWELEDLI